MSFIEEIKHDRAKYIGGSDVAIIMGISPYKTPYQLWLEKTGQIEAEDISGLFHVQRGVENEPIALAKIEEQTGLKFEANKRFVSGVFSGELDGYNPKMIVEIKCMGKDAHDAVLNGIIPEHYIVQCQVYMNLSGVSECMFASYRPEDETLNTHIIKSDKKLSTRIVKTVMSFWLDNVQANIPPEYIDADYVDMENNQTFKQVAKDYKDALTKMKLYEGLVKEHKATLKTFMKDHARIKGHGLMMTEYERRGNVNYKNIPELQGVDLEQYRGKSIKVFDVRVK